MKRLNSCWITLALLLTATMTAAQPRVAKETIPQDAPADIRELLDRCFSPAASVRGDSAKKLGERAAQASAAVPILIAMLGDEESYMDSVKIGTMVIHGMSSPGRQSAVALGLIAGPAVEPLLNILRNKAVANRDLAALALGGAKDSRAVPLLIDALTEKDNRLRAEAAAALGGFKDSRAIPPLIAVLRDVDEKVAARAHESLQELTAQTFGKDAAQWQTWWQSQKK
jgi:HEAT repeat protein